VQHTHNKKGKRSGCSETRNHAPSVTAVFQQRLRPLGHELDRCTNHTHDTHLMQVGWKRGHATQTEQGHRPLRHRRLRVDATCGQDRPIPSVQSRPGLRQGRGPPRPGLAGRALPTHTRPPGGNPGTKDSTQKLNALPRGWANGALGRPHGRPPLYHPQPHPHNPGTPRWHAGVRDGRAGGGGGRLVTRANGLGQRGARDTLGGISPIPGYGARVWYPGNIGREVRGRRLITGAPPLPSPSRCEARGAADLYTSV